jgi:hypothetical protein
LRQPKKALQAEVELALLCGVLQPSESEVEPKLRRNGIAGMALGRQSLYLISNPLIVRLYSEMSELFK